MSNMNFGNITLYYHRHNLFGEAFEIIPAKLKYNDLTFVIEGTMHYIVNKKEYVLNKGDVLFVPTGARRSRKAGYKADYISFNFFSDKPITCFHTHAKQVFDNEIKSLLKYYDTCTANRLNHVNEKCANILNTLLIILFDFYNAPQHSKLVLEIIKYLNDNIQNQVTLKDIENKVFFSPCYFCKKFKTEMNLSVIQYFNTIKVERAKMLICEQTMTLEEIAFHLGFGDYNYFSRVFKKIAKCSPTKFKSQYIIVE